MKPFVIRMEGHFHVPVERVFRAWTSPHELAAWAWGSLGSDVRAEIDLRVGGAFAVSTARLDGGRWVFAGTYTDIQPSRRIAHTLHWDAPMGYDPSVGEDVAVEFIGQGGSTTVVFEHHGDFSEAAGEGHRRGWTDVLETLKKHLENEHDDLSPPSR